MSSFQKKCHTNVFLDKHEIDVRKNIGEIANGYPGFIDRYLGKSKTDISKANVILLKILQMKNIENIPESMLVLNESSKITIADCTKIMKEFKTNYDTKYEPKSNTKFVNAIKNPRIK